MRRTHRLTSPTAHAGIEVKALLPGQVVEGGHTELWFVFFDFGIKISNRCQRTTWAGALEKAVEWRINQVAQPGIGDGSNKGK